MPWLRSFLCMGEPDNDSRPTRHQPTSSQTQAKEIQIDMDAPVQSDLEASKQASKGLLSHGLTGLTGSAIRRVSTSRSLERVQSIPEDRPMRLTVQEDSTARNAYDGPSSAQSGHSAAWHSNEPSMQEMSRLRPNDLRPRSSFALDAVPGVDSPGLSGRLSRKQSMDAGLSPGNSPLPSPTSSATRSNDRASRRLNPGSHSRLSVGGAVIALHDYAPAHEIESVRSSAQINVKPRSSESSSSLSPGDPNYPNGLHRLRSINNGNTMAARLAQSRSISLVLGHGLPPPREKQKRSLRPGPTSSPTAWEEISGREKSGVVRRRPATDLTLLVDEDEDDERGDVSNSGPRSTMDGSSFAISSSKSARTLSSVYK